MRSRVGEGMPLLKAQFKEIQMNEMDDDITFADLLAMAQSVINRRTNQAQQQVQPEGEIPEVEPEGQGAMEKEQLQEQLPRALRL